MSSTNSNPSDSSPPTDAVSAAALTPAEARFERIRQTGGLFLGPAAFVIVAALPLPGLTSEAHRLASVVALVVVWWISEALPIPITALLGSALMVLVGVAPAAEAFAPFANPVIFLFIGAFMIGRAISAHGLDQRVALSLLSLRQVRGSLGRMRLALAGFAFLVSGWLSNTATAAMIVPMAIGVLSSSGVFATKDARPYTAGFLLTLSYAIGIGGLLTPVGSPPNLITIGLLDRLAGVQIDFVTWMMLTTPICLAVGAALYVLSDRMFPRASAAVQELNVVLERPTGGMTPGQRNCLIAFVVAVVLWLAPGIYSLIGPEAPLPGRTYVGRLNEGVVAVVAAALLFMLPVNWSERRFTLRWSDASQIDWGTILLFGGGLSLGEQMFKTGLAERLGVTLVQMTGAESLYAVTAMAILLGILITEITSNTAATNMIVPVVISMCQAGGLNPVPPALGACIGASLAFMLPISTPPNAIVYGTGYVRITEMLRLGVALDAVGFVITLIGIRIMCPLLGLGW